MTVHDVTDVAAPETRPAARVAGRRRGGRRDLWTALAFIAPAALILLGVRVIPLGEAAWLSLMRWDGFADPVFVGLDNFRALATDGVFWQSLRNTLAIVAAIPIWVLGPLVLALGLQTRPPGWRVLRIAYVVPAILSPVIVGTYYSVLLRFNGPVNDLLRAVGLEGIVRGWLADPDSALISVIAIILWAGFGVGVLLYMAALGNVDQTLYDAARVDGASTWRMHWHVSFPQVLPVIEFYAVVVLVSCFTSIFPYIFTLTRGGPGYRTNVLDLYVYNAAFESGRFGYASAIGVVLLVVLLASVVVVTALFRRRSR